MSPPTVGILSPGDMGHALGRRLREHGVRVLTCLRGRSGRTAGLAAAAGIEDVPDDDALVRQCDVLLSVLVPAQATSVAERVADALSKTEAALLYADCNAIAPATTRQVGAIVEAAGARFVDAGIIGGPPGATGPGPRIYASGEHAPAFAELAAYGLDIRPLGPTVGQASGLKMCYAALTKGLTALGTELLVAAEAMGLAEPLRAELHASQPVILDLLTRQIPSMPPKAYRWVGEMEEIASTFGALGLTPAMLSGAADMYRLVGTTPLGAETPEARQQGQTLDAVIGVLAAALERRGA